MDLHEALFKRVSQRKFREEAMSEKSLNAFLSGLDSIPLLHPEHSLSIRFITYGELKTLFPNFYKSVIYAPYFLFFYAEDNEESMQNIGYLGQLSSLWLSCNGYGSCWQVVKGIEQTVWPEAEKLLRDQELAKEEARQKEELELEQKENREISREVLVEESKQLSLDSSSKKESAQISEEDDKSLESNNENKEDIILFPAKPQEQILAFGIPDNRIKIGRPVSRKKLHSLLISGSPEPNIAFINLLDAAKAAPSEYNSQPWRFWVTEHCIHVFIKPARIFGSKLRHQNEHIAVGCMLANLITQAELGGLNVELRQEKEPFAPIKELEYVISIYISDPYDI